MSTPMITRVARVAPASASDASAISLRERFDAALKDDAAASLRRERDRKRKTQADDLAHTVTPPPMPWKDTLMANGALGARVPLRASPAHAGMAPPSAGADASAGHASPNTAAGETKRQEGAHDAPAAPSPTMAMLSESAHEPAEPQAPAVRGEDEAVVSREASLPVREGGAERPPSSAHSSTNDALAARHMTRTAQVPVLPEPQTGTHLTYTFRTWAPGHVATAHLFSPTTPGGEMRASVEAGSPRVAQALLAHPAPPEGVQVAWSEGGADERDERSRQHADDHGDEDLS